MAPAPNTAANTAAPAHTNTAALGLALAAGALLVLGGVAYACFLLVGRARRAQLARRSLPHPHPSSSNPTSRVSSDNSIEKGREKGPRPLVLPAKLAAARKYEEEGKAPRRMILSPLFQLPVYDLEDLGKGAFPVHAGLSWRASLHAMGAAAAQVRQSVDLERKEVDEDEDDVPLATLRRSASRSPDFSTDSPTVATPRTPFAPPAAHTKVVEIIQSRGASPDIVVSDCGALPSCASSSSSLASDADADAALLQVPPMSWTAPRAPDDVVHVLGTASQQPPAKRQRQRRGQDEGRQVRKKGSVTKLVAALGDISNAIRLRPELPSAPASPKREKGRAATREGGRKENAV
ncbi:hypothetical protein PsYK624_066410 [Phanerochaete sordida]|uniref:Uncharacterized protein n=1 Tax=Phanerochaete sordida TaxID=48140 RepID=A0A9P3G737_9APHY|nr:hypothetical protein PsYK624_066410 [Phanerochaete sordida]